MLVILQLCMMVLYIYTPCVFILSIDLSLMRYVYSLSRGNDVSMMFYRLSVGMQAMEGANPAKRSTITKECDGCRPGCEALTVCGSCPLILHPSFRNTVCLCYSICDTGLELSIWIGTISVFHQKDISYGNGYSLFGCYFQRLRYIYHPLILLFVLQYMLYSS